MLGLASDPVRVIAFYKNLAGSSTRSTLVLGADGRQYVLKLHPNAVGPNTLANEAIGSDLMFYLGIPTPRWRVIVLDKRDIARLPKDEESSCPTDIKPLPGRHFASEYLAHPDYEISDGRGGPDSIDGGRVQNVLKFVDVYLFDLWTFHVDTRQWVLREHRQTGFGEVFFIDNDRLFGNKLWAESHKIADRRLEGGSQPTIGLYERRLQERVREFKQRIPSILNYTLSRTPPEWHQGDIVALERWLMKRLTHLDDLVRSDLALKAG